MSNAWRNFRGTLWTEEINIRDFIQHNYTQRSTVLKLAVGDDGTLTAIEYAVAAYDK